MCGGGGNAAAAAQQQEAQRQAGITNAVNQINAIYDSPARQAQYTQFQNALQNYNLNQLNQQNVIANRNLKFAMARQGLTGGSADADSAAMQERLYNQGVLKGDQQAMAGAAQLRAQDQNSKQQLIGLAESGLDATSAEQMGLSSMQANIQGAMATGEANDVGNAFAGLGSYFTNSNQAKQLQQMYMNPSTFGLFGQQPGIASTAPWLSGSGSQFTQPNVASWYQ